MTRAQEAEAQRVRKEMSRPETVDGTAARGVVDCASETSRVARQRTVAAAASAPHAWALHSAAATRNVHVLCASSHIRKLPAAAVVAAASAALVRVQAVEVTERLAT